MGKNSGLRWQELGNAHAEWRTAVLRKGIGGTVSHNPHPLGVVSPCAKGQRGLDMRRLGGGIKESLVRHPAQPWLKGCGRRGTSAGRRSLNRRADGAQQGAKVGSAAWSRGREVDWWESNKPSLPPGATLVEKAADGEQTRARDAGGPQPPIRRGAAGASASEGFVDAGSQGQGRRMC